MGPEPCCPIVELRQYTLHPGARDVLVALFDRELVESQEALGMTVIGQFRDLERPDRFVWLRGFPDMGSRATALAAFYGGPVWAAHRQAANATMIDSDDVLLLRPARPGSGFRLNRADRPPPGCAAADGLVVATIFHLRPGEAGFDDAGAPATFVTESSPNNFPRLPVREGENVLVRFGAEAAAVPAGMAARLTRPPEILRLAPTARSLLRGMV